MLTVRRSGAPTALPGAWLPTWHFGMTARCLPPPRHESLLSVLGTEGVGDALVGGVGPPVDAVGVLAGAGVSGQGDSPHSRCHEKYRSTS